MSGRAAVLQGAGLDLCAAVAVMGADALALVGAARRRLDGWRSAGRARMQPAGARQISPVAAVAYRG